MAVAIETVVPSPEAAAMIRAQASQLESYMKGPAALAVLRRYVHWHSLEQSAQAFGDRGSDILLGIFGDAFVGEHMQLDQGARTYATIVAGLNTRELELVPWGADGDVHIGITRAGAVPQGGLRGWPIVLLVVAAAGVAWVLVDSWLAVRKQEADNDRLRAETAAKMNAAVAAVSKTDPSAATALATALAKANDAANAVQPGLLSQLAGSVNDLTSTARAGIEGLGGLGILLLGYMFYRSKWGQRAA